ncbi:hypothetical protein ACFP3Q_07945 [Nocardioides sp. GCM10027113]|uniref:hypothetical protein n=1 Tax=unclassified Nocardioides TaxID=2615069 RepID=UPI003615B368
MTDPGVRLRRGAEQIAATDALATACGGRVGLSPLLEKLDRQGRRGWAPGLRTRWAFTWDREDRRTTRWWPQGISTGADASGSPDGLVEGHRVVLTTWYAKPRPDGHHGVRLSLVDLDSHRYAHVLLVDAAVDAQGNVSVAPVKIHAGGLVWRRGIVHVAATARGFVTAHLDDLVRVPERSGLTTYGYRWLLPVRTHYAAETDEGTEPFRFSFFSLDRSGGTPSLLAGEYARGRQTRRLVRYALEPGSGHLATDGDGVARPTWLVDAGVGHMQGVVSDGDWLVVSTSHGPFTLGSLHRGEPGAWTRHRWATPMGPEDLVGWPSRGELWSLSEHPHRRWVYPIRL